MLPASLMPLFWYCHWCRKWWYMTIWGPSIRNLLALMKNMMLPIMMKMMIHPPHDDNLLSEMYWIQRIIWDFQWWLRWWYIDHKMTFYIRNVLSLGKFLMHSPPMSFPLHTLLNFYNEPFHNDDDHLISFFFGVFDDINI